MPCSQTCSCELDSYILPHHMLMLVQLIDPYWTFIPVLIAHFYAWVCPSNELRTGRQHIALALIWLWSIRLTHSYFRRCSSAAMLATRPFFSTPFF